MTPAIIVNAKLLDFGLSRVRAYRWAAPEVFSKMEAPKLAADIYSFGCMVYFIAAGERPLATWEDKAIRTAKCRGDCCLLLMPNRLLLEHSWPVVEQTTCHTPECRPTIAVIHEHLTQWPECQQALASNGISLARPAPPERDAVLTCWQDIRQARQTVQSQRTLRVQEKQSQQRRRRRQLLPPISEEQQQILCTSTRLKFQSFAETPLQTMRISALDAAAQWNHRIQGSSCCTFHAVVHTLGEAQQILWSSECQSCENIFAIKTRNNV